jgi:hypothetical protein
MNIRRPNCVYLFFIGGFILFAKPAFALLPFPISANQRGTSIACLEKQALRYDAYLPPGYSTNGTPLPILYTLHPNGGGMVGNFQTVCSSMNIIVVGILSSSNGAPWDIVLRDFYAVTRDIRLRVLYDPTAEFVGGFSGGGENSFVFSRFRSQHVAGIFGMGGWMGRQVNGYVTTDRVQTNLLVARATGTSDTSAIYFLPLDSNYLATCGAVIKDWSFSGGHTINVPDATKTAALTWLLNQRIPAGATDRTNAQLQADDWQARISAGQQQTVLQECVNTLQTRPRSWFAYQAQLVLDQLATNYTSFRALDMNNLAQGDFASDLFYYYGRGAANLGDLQRYRSALKALTGVTGVNGDRAGDIRSLLLQFSYPGPILQCSSDQNLGRMNLWLSKETPGLDYFLQSRSNLVSDAWQDTAATTFETNTLWSAGVDLPSASDGGFNRIRTAPSTVPASPPWPPP